jgi:hypothetical protein
MRTTFLGAGAMLACACSGTASAPDAPDGTPADAGGSADGASDATSGSGTVTGSADGTPFTTAAMALWIGAPDAPDTTVVFVFSKPVACSDLAAPGWDKRITDATQFLEMKMFGAAPATFTVTGSLTPAPGEASVNYTLSSTTSTPVETSATSGTVTLTQLIASKNATGSFALAFSSNKLSGTYDAVYCPGGHEP